MNTESNSCSKATADISNCSSTEVGDFIKNYKYVIEQLKAKLHEAVKENQKFKFTTVDNSNHIKRLQECLQKSNIVNLKLSKEVKHAKQHNLETVLSFSTFKEKFYELEVNYDETVHKLKSQIDAYKIQLEQVQLESHNKEQKMDHENHELQEKLMKVSNDYAVVDNKYNECLANLDKLQIDFDHQNCEFQSFKRNTDINMRTLTEKFNDNLERLKKELELKEETITQCKLNKLLLEQEKDKIIYNHECKIKQLQQSATQPNRRVASVTAVVSASVDSCTNRNCNNGNSNCPMQPLQPLPPLQPLQKSEASQPIENHTSNKENKKRSMPGDDGPTIKTTRRTVALKSCQPLLPVLVNTISLDEDEDSDDSVFNMYRPNRIHIDDDLYVPDTSDTSDVFDQLKNSRK